MQHDIGLLEEIEEDISRLLGTQNKIKTRDQALELTRLMVKLEFFHDRKTLLKVLQNSTDFSALKAFLRYKGLSLLWSWMVDASEKRKRFRLEILNTLKIMPIPNRNILIDSKVLQVVEKWSSYSEPELPPTAPDDDDDDYGSSNSDDGREDDKENKDNNDDSQPESDGNDDSNKKEEIANLAAELLDRWKLLREVFRIPKKPQTPDKRSESEASMSPGEEKRHGKRKFEGDVPERPSKLFSPKSSLSSPKRLAFESPKPLMTESPKPLLQSPSTAVANNSSFWSPAASSNDTPLESRDFVESDWTESSDGYTDFEDNQEASTPVETVNTEEHWEWGNAFNEGPRGRGRFARGLNRPWRNRQGRSDPQGECRGRGWRGRGRGRGRGGYGNPQYEYGNENEAGFNKFGPNENPNFNYGTYNHPPTRNAPYNYQNVKQGRGQHRGRGRGRDQPFAYGDPSKVLTGANAVAINQPWQGQPNPRVPPPPEPGYSQFHQGIPVQDTSYGSPSQLYGDRSPATPTMPQNQFGNMRFPHSQQHPQSQEYHTPQHHSQSQHRPQSQQQPYNIRGQMNQPNQQQYLAQQYYRQNVPASQNVVSPQWQQQHRQQPPQGHVPIQQHQFQVSQGYHQQSGHAYSVSQAPQQMAPTNAPHAPTQTPTLTQMNIMQHLQELVNQSKASKGQSAPPPSQTVEERTPEYANTTPQVVPVTPVRDYKATEPASPVSSKPIPPLPPNWKTATDPEGKIYYYHIVSRKTQWERPTWESEGKQPPRRKSSESSAKHEQKAHKEVEYRRQPPVHEQPGPRTPPSSPPHSPISPYNMHRTTTAPADTTVTRLQTTQQGPTTPPPVEHGNVAPYETLSAKRQRIRDQFKTKLSGVVINCLNPYQKVDCKQARITSVDDFKFLARKLTHGLMMKEIARVKSDEELECKDSVKIKVKEYIKNYMRKYGATFIRS